MDEALNAKYIIIEDVFHNEVPIVFCSLLKHDSIAKPMLVKGKILSIVSAGFAIWGGKWFIANGESISLGVQSRYDIDSDIINKYLNIRR